MLFDNSFLLMLVYVDDQWLDIAGNEYPTEGYVEAKNFTHDIDISMGLYGIPWGQTDMLAYENLDQGHWVVVKIEKNDEFIKTSIFDPYCKFRGGFVVHSGTLSSCAHYIIRHKDGAEFIEEGRAVRPEEIVGSKQYLSEKRT